MAKSSLPHDSGDLAMRSKSGEFRFCTLVPALILAGFGMLLPAGVPSVAQEPRPAGGEVRTGDVRAWEGALTLPTYSWVEDINPKFWALEDFEAALTYPHNLHVGRSNRPIEAPAQYWRGMALRALGREAEAQQAWQAGAEGADVPGIQNEFREKCHQALQSAADSAASNVEIERESAAAVSLSEDLPVYICRKIDRDLVITGKADDALWQTAHVAELRDATAGRPGRFPTVARLLYNERFLYIAFQCKDDYPWGTFTERDDPIYEEECVEAFLCPSGKTRQYYEINVSPRGTIFDAFILNGRPVGGDRIHFQGLKEFTCEGLQIKVFVEGELNEHGVQGWWAEYAIPFTSLPGADETPPRSGDEWRMNLFRIDAPERDRPEFYAWSIPGAADFHRPWRFGTLLFE